MCTIIGWAGRLPKGLLSRLMMQAETRGRDSTGVAFRTTDDAGKPSNLCYRQIVPARTFAELHKKFMGDARRAVRGLAHTRRASPGMPVDNANAHPYTYPYGGQGKYFFAHNGRVENWRAMRDEAQVRFKTQLDLAVEALAAKIENVNKDDLFKVASAIGEDEIAALTAEQVALRLKVIGMREDWAPVVAASCRLRYVENATTDSMVLGPCVEARDFSQFVGCMGLVWMRAENVYVLRFAKEAIGANIIWKYKERQQGEPDGDQVVTVVASTAEIIAEAINKIAETIEVDYSFIDINEREVYRIEPTGLVSEGRVAVQGAVEDEYSSAPVEDKNGQPLEQSATQ